MNVSPSIDPVRLNSIRRARKLGRPRLAKLTGLTERFVARLEGAIPAKGELTAEVVVRVAAAL